MERSFEAEHLSDLVVDRSKTVSRSKYLGYYPGHKGRKARKYILTFPPHKTYLELFAGMAGVLQRKPHSSIEFANDVGMGISAVLWVFSQPEMAEELIQRLMKLRKGKVIFKRHLKRLYEYLDSENKFEDLTDLQLLDLAESYMACLKHSYGSIVTRTSEVVFDYNEFRPSNYTFAEETLWQFSERMRYVQIEHMDFRKLLSKIHFHYTDCFWFVDPPYYEVDNLYEPDFTQQDHEDLAVILESTEAKWMLTIDDCEWVRKRYAAFHIMEIDHLYTLTSTTSSGNRPKIELVITNYDPEKTPRWYKPKRKRASF